MGIRSDIRKIRFKDDGRVAFLCGHHLSELIDKWKIEHPAEFSPYMASPQCDGIWELVNYWDRDWDEHIGMDHVRPEDYGDFVCERCRELAMPGREVSEKDIPKEQTRMKF